MAEKKIKNKTSVTTPKKKSVKVSDKKISEKPVKKTVPEKEQPNKKLVRVEELAQLVGVTVRRIQQLQQEGVIKPEPGTVKREGARYDFARSIISIVRYYREKADRRRSGDSEEMAKEKLSHEAIKRELGELKLAELKKELHRGEDIEKVMGAIFTRLRINLLTIPMGVAPLLRDQTDINVIAEKIRERIHRAMSEVADIDLDVLMAEEDADST